MLNLGQNYAIILAEQQHDNDRCLHAAYFCNPVQAKLGHIWAKITLLLRLTSNHFLGQDFAQQ